jgi:acetylornithine deacetylase/succinyl-diaminopimelate desuccinylase-like protein
MESGTSNACGRLIPKEATAVISVRTVPDQEPDEIVGAVKSHLQHEFAKRRTTNKLHMEQRCGFKWWEGSASGPESSKLFQAARNGVRQAWGLPGKDSDVLFVREGGTMPLLPALQAVLGCDAVQIPLGQASDAAHLPNESISEQNLFRGVDAIWHTLMNLSPKTASRQVSKASA